MPLLGIFSDQLGSDSCVLLFLNAKVLKCAYFLKVHKTSLADGICKDRTGVQD